jgi:error-prone DNA polymerase
LLAYVSAWFKCHYPAVFACALLNSQPMGFYAPAQIVRDAIEHGIEVRPVDVNFSDWDCTLETAMNGFALRLGLRQIKGLGEEDAQRLVARRGNGYADSLALSRRGGLSPRVLAALARADACRSLSLDRRQALWALQGQGAMPLPLFAAAAEEEQGAEAPVTLPVMALGEHVAEDYSTLHLSLKSHPLALLRHRLPPSLDLPAARLATLSDGARVGVAGLVLVRQRPGTASGVIFATLEDETGVANIVIWPRVFESHRRIVLTAHLMGVVGRLQREGLVIHVVADRLVDMSFLLGELAAGSPSPPAPLARADEVARPGHDPRVAGYHSRDFH